MVVVWSDTARLLLVFLWMFPRMSGQREKDGVAVREKELVMRAEAGDAARRACQVAEGRVETLESRLQQCTRERDELRERVEDLQKAQGGLDSEASDEQGHGAG